MRNYNESKKATVVTRVLTGAGGLTVLVAVLAAGVKWSCGATRIPGALCARDPASDHPTKGAR